MRLPAQERPARRIAKDQCRCPAPVSVPWQAASRRSAASKRQNTSGRDGRKGSRISGCIGTSHRESPPPDARHHAAVRGEDEHLN